LYSLGGTKGGFQEDLETGVQHSYCRLGVPSVSTLKRGTSGRSEVKWGEVKHGREEEGDYADADADA